jgi:hypothetical protein
VITRTDDDVLKTPERICRVTGIDLFNTCFWRLLYHFITMSIKWFILRTVLHSAFLMEAFLYQDNLQSYFDLFTSELNWSVCDNIKFFHGNFCWFFFFFFKLPFINPVVSNLRTASTLLFNYVSISKRDVWRISVAIKFWMSEMCPLPVTRNPHFLFYTEHSCSPI